MHATHSCIASFAALCGLLAVVLPGLVTLVFGGDCAQVSDYARFAGIYAIGLACFSYANQGMALFLSLASLSLSLRL